MKTAIAISPTIRNVLNVAKIPSAAMTAIQMARIAPRILPMIRPMDPVCPPAPLKGGPCCRPRHDRRPRRLRHGCRPATRRLKSARPGVSRWAELPGHRPDHFVVVTHHDPNMNGNRRYVFTEARIDCKALTAQGRPAHMTAVSGCRPAGIADWSSGVMGFSRLSIVQYNALYEAVRFGGSCRGGQHHPGDRRPGPAGTVQPGLDPGPAGRALWRQPQNAGQHRAGLG